MSIATEVHGNMSCQIEVSANGDLYAGTLKYNSFEIGYISGPDLDILKGQFQAICVMVDMGGMVRHGIIMLGYHNGDFGGDVLLVNGEVIGEWTSDDEEWCHFTSNEDNVVSCSAPSPWMLHDFIKEWVDAKDDDDGIAHLKSS